MSLRANRILRHGSVVLAVLCLSLLATACSSSSPAADPLASLTAKQIASKATADLGDAPSVTLTGQAPVSGQQANINVTLTRHGCDWKIALGHQGSVELIVVGSTVWMKADTQFWESQQGTSQGRTIAALLDGRYAQMPASDTGSLVSYCSPEDFANQVNNGDSMVKGPVVTVNGQQALEVRDTSDGSVGYVSMSADPQLLRITAGKGDGPGQIDLTYNGPGTISPPPASQAVNISSLTG
jgi:hypothetical protein